MFFPTPVKHLGLFGPQLESSGHGPRADIVFNINQ